MRAICLSLAFLALFSSTAPAQNYRLEFHADEALTSCELAVNTPGFIRVHMVVKGESGLLAAVAFRAVKPACMRSAVWITDAWHMPTVRLYYHDTQHPDGVEVVVDCIPSPPNPPPSFPVYLGSIMYYVTEPTDACCFYQAVATPSRATPVLILCVDAAERPMATSGLVMNPNETCRCDIPLATEKTTWGAVKALYH